jgi:hypothetical protein
MLEVALRNVRLAPLAVFGRTDVADTAEVDRINGSWSHADTGPKPKPHIVALDDTGVALFERQRGICLKKHR